MITSAVNFLKIRILLLGLCTLPVFTKANIQIVYSKQADEGKCNGVIVVEATGNAGPFDITLNGEVVAQNFSGRKYFTGLCSGEYSFLVTNLFACETPLNTVIHECGQISVEDLQAGIHPPSACGEQDGSFGFGHGVSATGGTAPYSFILKDHKGDILPMEEYGGWENLGAGDYHLTIIDGNGCRGEEEFTIEGEDIKVSYGASPECEHSANGYIWAYAYAPSSGSAEETYHYEWSTGDEFESSEGILLEGLAAGTYMVTVSTENGACTYTETIVVEGLVSEAPLVVEAEVANTCPQYPSGYIGLQISGGVPRPNSTHFTYNIQWEDYNGLYNRQRNNLEAGNYTVTVTDLCGNTVTETYTIGAFPDYSIEVADIDHLCPDETSGAIDISLVGGDGPFTFSWYNEGEIYPPVSTAEDLTGVPGGTYRVKAYDSHGCRREKPFTVLASSLDQIQSTVKGSCEELSPGIGSISLSVNTPFPVTSIMWDHENQTTSSISELDPGLYHVTITDSECTYELEYEVTQYTYSESPDPPGSCWQKITCGSELDQRIWTGILDTEFKSEAGACYVTATCGNGEHWNPPNSGDLYWDNHDGRVDDDAADIIECWRDQICEIHWIWTDPFGITHQVVNPPEIVDSRVPFDVTRKYIGTEQPDCTYLSDELIEWWCGPVLIDIDCRSNPEFIMVPSSSAEIEGAITHIKVYPNPSKENLNIEFHLEKDEFIRFTLYDPIAKHLQVQEQFFKSGLNVYSLQHWREKPAGLYILEISDGKGMVIRKKIMKY